jgi:hypothetical protein
MRDRDYLDPRINDADIHDSNRDSKVTTTKRSDLEMTSKKCRWPDDTAGSTTKPNKFDIEVRAFAPPVGSEIQKYTNGRGLSGEHKLATRSNPQLLKTRTGPRI